MKIDFATTDYDQKEIDAVNRVLQREWLASGEENERFEKEFSEFIGSRYAVCVNSGSSANLLALASLGLPVGSKVITSACGFPATLSPILHLNLSPVLVDYSYSTHNISVEQIRKAIAEHGDIKAIILAHTLGNPVEILLITDECKKRGIAIIEDCCEAVGSDIYGRYCGTIGTLGTFSFYPAHQMTAFGAGGMVVTDNEQLYQRMKSLRDWGKMYDWDSSKGGNETDYSSPIGYHRGYTYQTIGWNFKLAEGNCAFGREQLKKLERFKCIRMENWRYLYDRIKSIDEIYVPHIGSGSSPFGFCMNTVKGKELGMHLERAGIKHRPFFAGNIAKQPAFKDVISGEFPVADRLMNGSIFVGCHTKMTRDDLDKIIGVVYDYFSNLKL